jgi:hypothetical protein
MATRKQRSAARKNIKKAAKSRKEKANDLALVQENAHRLGKRRR